MYKVFVNEITLILTDNLTDYKQFTGDKIHFTGKKNLKLFITGLDSELKQSCCVYHYDIDELYYYFRRIFKLVKAAGGLVQNSKGEFLFIKRKGYWDIPKGKMEKEETPEYTAVREVEEECGVSGLSIVYPIKSTYHTYKYGGKKVLKKTYWFLMKTDYLGELTPQLEEEITEVKWLPRSRFYEIKENTFNGILDLIEFFESTHRNFE